MASVHMCPEEQPTVRRTERTHELMTDTLPLLDATSPKVQKLADETCHANAWVHQVKNKLHIPVLSHLLPNNQAQRKSKMEG